VTDQGQAGELVLLVGIAAVKAPVSALVDAANTRAGMTLAERHDGEEQLLLAAGGCEHKPERAL